MRNSFPKFAVPVAGVVLLICLGLSGRANLNGVPVNLVVVAFGPRYTWKAPLHSRHSLQLFGQGLIGEDFGFSGLYPSAQGTTSSANSFALNTGLGADLSLTPHFSMRVLQIDYLRTQLPNSATNVQNSVSFAAGIVFHTRWSRLP